MTGTVVPQVAAADSKIQIGEHVQRHIGGWTFNMDTIWATIVAGIIVLVLGFWLRSRLTQRTDDHVPTKLQIIWEAVVKEVTVQVEDNLGYVNPFVVPLAVALFFFILFANWLELIPTQLNEHVHLLPAPTADTNLTYAMAIMVMVGVWIFGIRQKGVKGYFKHFLEPFPVMLPLNVLEELTKPITLALRLFGNIFAGGIMLSVIALIPFWGAWFPNIAWKLFDMAIGAIQAFIFALLTVLYFGMAGGGHEAEHAEESDTDTQHIGHGPPRAEDITDRHPEPATAG
jgi:F-type H+-transporting ATPase subunit a